jgi:putative oxidoreductase
MDFLVSEGFRTAIHVVGRVFFCTCFIVGGLSQLMSLEETSALAASRGVPAPKPATVVGGLVFVLGGILVLLGWRRFIGAGLLAVLAFATAVLMHPFWKETEPATRKNEMAHFMKDVALAGGALLIAFYAGTEWPVALS